MRCVAGWAVRLLKVETSPSVRPRWCLRGRGSKSSTSSAVPSSSLQEHDKRWCHKEFLRFTMFATEPGQGTLRFAVTSLLELIWNRGKGFSEAPSPVYWDNREKEEESAARSLECEAKTTYLLSTGADRLPLITRDTSTRTANISFLIGSATLLKRNHRENCIESKQNSWGSRIMYSIIQGVAPVVAILRRRLLWCLQRNLLHLGELDSKTFVISSFILLM